MRKEIVQPAAAGTELRGPMELSEQRQRVYQRILAAGKTGEGEGITVYKEKGDHLRHFIKIEDGNQYFIFFTAVEKRADFGVAIVRDHHGHDYSDARELRNPKAVMDNAWLEDERARTKMKDPHVNIALLQIALTHADSKLEKNKVKEVPTAELVAILRGASVLK